MYCAPERLQTLQRIFDTIWMEVEFDISPQATLSLRDEIARCVMSYAKADLTEDDIVFAVLHSLEFRLRRNRSRRALQAIIPLSPESSRALLKRADSA